MSVKFKLSDLHIRKQNGTFGDLTALKGDTGPGLPAGGADGDVLVKDGSTNYATRWETSPFARNAEIGLLVNGNVPANNVNKGQYVILRNSTISGKADGLYRAVASMTAGQTIDGSYLGNQITIGGLNAVSAKNTTQDATVNTPYSGLTMYYARWVRCGDIVCLNLNFKLDANITGVDVAFTLSNIPLPAVACLGTCVSASSSQYVGMLEIGAPNNTFTATTVGTMQAGNYIRASFTYICL